MKDSEEEMAMMDYTEFKAALEAEVQEKMGKDVWVRTVLVDANNHTVRDGLTCEDGYYNINPLVRLEDFYEDYQKYGMEWCVEAAAKIISTSEKSGADQILGTWETAKKKVLPELVNLAWNRGRLERFPHDTFLDLAVVFRLRVREARWGQAVTTVTRGILQHWGTGEEELREAAYANLKEEAMQITDIWEAMKGLTELGFNAEEVMGRKELYIFSNCRRIKGASAMLRADLLKKFAEKKGKDLIILPSSVHEVLLMPEEGITPAGSLKSMVWDINRDQVAEEERLSDEVYRFRRSTGEVEIA